MDTNTDPAAVDPDMAFSDSFGWDLTMASDGGAGHSQQATPLHPQVSSSISSRNAQVAPIWSLTTYLHIVVTPAAS